jgi:excisionase family DNA binding protein
MPQATSKNNPEVNEMDKTNQDATLTVDEAHALIGVRKISRGGLYAAINRKEVPHLRLGNRILIPRHAFEKWLDAGTGTAS